MPVYPPIVDAFPQSWTIFGHSYFQMAFGTRTQQGRPDGAMRSLLYNQQFLNTVNHAQAGTRLSVPGDFGFGRILNLVKGWTGGAGNLGNTAPYVVGGQGGSGGAYLIGYGINDLGYNGGTPQNNLAYQHAMRTAISRCRISTLISSGGINYPGGTGTFAQGGFFTASASNGFATGGAANLMQALSTGHTITITLPADYNGETVAICVMGTSNAASGQNLWTISGTAGASGTFTSDLIFPQASLAFCPVTVRIKTLTSAAAGQTIILTTTTLGGSGTMYYDSAWLEADNAPPVIVCNAARLCDTPLGGGTSGYNAYAFTLTTSTITGGSTTVASAPGTLTLTGGTSLGLSQAGKVTCPSSGGTVTITFTGITPTTITGCTYSGGSGTFSSNVLSWAGPTDADVVLFNQSLYSLIPEFDGMVQVADIDGALSKAVACFSYDGLHMNEIGSSRMAQAIVNAVNALQPTSPQGHAANLNPPFPVITPLARPYVNGQWYTSDTAGGPNGTPYAPVIGDLWALPVFWSNGVAAWSQWCMDLVTASSAPTVFFAIYEDRMMQGYPMTMHIQPANGSALALNATAGPFNSVTSAGNGFLSQSIDAGLYWLVVKFVTAGTCTIRTCKGPSPWMPNLASTGAGGVTPCGWFLSGQGTSPMAGRFPSGASAVDNVPMIGVKALIAQS